MVVNTRRRSRTPQRGFTLVELMIAGTITAFLVGSMATSMGLLAKAKNGARLRLDAALRADAALNAIRADLVSIIRSDDLFDTYFMLRDTTIRSPIGDLARDEVIVFNTHLRPVRDIAYNGEGQEYESQFRVIEDSGGPVLWQRRDPVHDQYFTGGGNIEPAVEGIVGLDIEAYDGNNWYADWDSDVFGLPVAISVTVVASGHRLGEDPFEDSPLITLRTVVPVDRAPALREHVLPPPEEIEAAMIAAGLAAPGGPGGPGAPGADPNSGLDPEIVNTVNNSGVTNMDEVNAARGPGSQGSGGNNNSSDEPPE